MDLELELDKLTNDEASNALQAPLKNLTILKPEYGAIIGSEAALSEVGQAAAVALGKPLDIRAISQSDATLVKKLLALAAADPELRPVLKNYLEGKRETLLEPVTSALVLAGIVFVLSTHVEVKAKRKNGKTDWEVKVVKKPTSEGFLEKFFGLFT
jgi:hypothetical protein